MASQDTNDFVHIHEVIENQAFQQRCWLSYLFAAFAVAAESIETTASAVTAAGNAVLTFTATPVNITNLVASDLTTNPSALTSTIIPKGARVISVTATTATLDRNIVTPGVSIGDIIRFAPAFHAERRRLAAALFSGTVDRMLLALAVLSDATNRTNCLADKSVLGGNITDANMNTVATNTFTGLAIVKNW